MPRYRPPDYLPREVLERPDFIAATSAQSWQLRSNGAAPVSP